MPRNGGTSQNGPFEENDITHGTGAKDLSSKVDRADKTAPLPEAEKGEGLPDANASGGQSQGLAQGPDAGQGGRGSTN